MMVTLEEYSEDKMMTKLGGALEVSRVFGKRHPESWHKHCSHQHSLIFYSFVPHFVSSGDDVRGKEREVHLTGEETEAQRGKVLCPKLDTLEVARLWLKLTVKGL